MAVYKTQNEDKKIEAIIVVNNVNEHVCELVHYTSTGVKVATLQIIDNNRVGNIDIHIDDMQIDNMEQAVEEQSYYECLKKTYKETRDNIDEDYALECDFLNIFDGACTMLEILYAAIECY